MYKKSLQISEQISDDVIKVFNYAGMLYKHVRIENSNDCILKDALDNSYLYYYENGDIVDMAGVTIGQLKSKGKKLMFDFLNDGMLLSEKDQSRDSFNVLFSKLYLTAIKPSPLEMYFDHQGKFYRQYLDYKDSSVYLRDRAGNIILIYKPGTYVRIPNSDTYIAYAEMQFRTKVWEFKSIATGEVIVQGFPNLGISDVELMFSKHYLDNKDKFK